MVDLPRMTDPDEQIECEILLEELERLKGLNMQKSHYAGSTWIWPAKPAQPEKLEDRLYPHLRKR